MVRINKEQVLLEKGDVLLLPSDNLNTIYNYLYEDSKKIQRIFKETIKQYQGLFGGKIQSNIVDLYLDPQFIQEKIISLSDKLKLSELMEREYIFQFIYVGGGYLLLPERSGIHLYKMPLTLIREVDVYRYRPEDKRVRKILNEKLDENLKEFWNKEYDYRNEFLNLFPDFINEFLNSDSPEKLSGGELIQRLYDSMGIKLFEHKKFEKVMVDDIQEKFEKII